MSLKPRRSIHASLKFGATSEKPPLNWLAHDLFLLLVFSCLPSLHSTSPFTLVAALSSRIQHCPLLVEIRLYIAPHANYYHHLLFTAFPRIFRRFGQRLPDEHATAVSIFLRTYRQAHIFTNHAKNRTMASYLPSFSSLSPVNTFPAYKGQYEVGTIDVEIPVSDLPVASDAPEGAVKTIAFRIFYPCQKPGKGDSHRPVRWIPQPQRQTINAFATFLGAGSKLASFISVLPQQLFWIKLPAHRNAKILDPPTDSKRWPVTMFSHGLAGSRNTYSYICGDMASNGMVVIAMDHRDGSSPIQYVRATADSPARSIPAVKIPHTASAETYEGRDKQLRIRLWETSMIYEALMKIDAGQSVENMDENTSWSRKERTEVLKQFEGALDIHRPGKVSWAGHSFGAATTVQLLKNIFYYQEKPQSASKPLIMPKSDAAIVQQILPESPALLLDMWCLPFRSPDQRWLLERPMPSYNAGGPQGDNILSVLSEGFFKWSDNREVTKQIISPPQQSPKTSASLKLPPSLARVRDDSPASSMRDSGYASDGSSPQRKPAAQPTRTKGPHMFYPLHSQHFNQSDFGVLFPWITKRFAKAEEPEHIIDLNVRAMVQVMREADIEVAGEVDTEILDKNKGVRSWVHIPLSGSQEANVAAAVEKRSSKADQAPRDGTMEEGAMEM
jgi:platelet-activating factor acetylhydrolase